MGVGAGQGAGAKVSPSWGLRTQRHLTCFETAVRAGPPLFRDSDAGT